MLRENCLLNLFNGLLFVLSSILKLASYTLCIPFYLIMACCIFLAPLAGLFSGLISLLNMGVIVLTLSEWSNFITWLQANIFNFGIVVLIVIVLIGLKLLPGVILEFINNLCHIVCNSILDLFDALARKLY